MTRFDEMPQDDVLARDIERMLAVGPSAEFVSRVRARVAESLTADIDSALAVDPSPHFVARVRTRISQEPAPFPWRVPQWTMALAAAAVLALALASIALWSRASVGPAPSATVARDVAPPVIAEGGASPRAAIQGEPLRAAGLKTGPPAVAAVRPPRVRSAAKSRASDPEPVIIVSAAEGAALRRLLAQLGAGRTDTSLDAPMLVVETIPPAPDEITIEPIEIAPLVPTQSPQGERQ